MSIRKTKNQTSVSKPDAKIETTTIRVRLVTRDLLNKHAKKTGVAQSTIVHRLARHLDTIPDNARLELLAGRGNVATRVDQPAA